MKTRYRILSILTLLCLFVSFLLTGCHGTLKDNDAPKNENQDSGFEVPEDFDTSKKYELTFWAKNDTNVRQTAIYQKAIDDFQALYPNVKVTLRLYNDYGKIYNDVITNIATETTPNICITYPDHIATYITGQDTVVPLDSLMNDEKFGLGGSELKFDAPTKEEIVPQFLGECKLGDKYYALPYMRSTEACYINKDYIEKMGYTLPEVLTWDFIWEVSEAALKKNSDGKYEVNGMDVMIPFIYKSTDNMMITMLKQKDAPYSKSNGEIGIFNDTTNELLYTVSEHVKSGAFSTFKISGYPGNFFNRGQCIFAIDSTAGATWIGSDAPLSDISEDQKKSFETVVMALPQFDVENPKMISQGPSVCIFNKEDSQEVLASWLFVQYLLTNDIQIGYSKTEGYVPVTYKAQQTDEYKSYLEKRGQDNDDYYSVKIDASKLLLDNMDNTFVTPVFNGSTSLRNTAGQMIENVAKSTKRKQNINDAYMEKLKNDMISLYKLDTIEVIPDENGTETDDTIQKTDRGPLPSTAVALIASICVIWVLIITYFIFDKHKNSKKC